MTGRARPRLGATHDGRPARAAGDLAPVLSSPSTLSAWSPRAPPPTAGHAKAVACHPKPNRARLGGDAAVDERIGGESRPALLPIPEPAQAPRGALAATSRQRCHQCVASRDPWPPIFPCCSVAPATLPYCCCAPAWGRRGRAAPVIVCRAPLRALCCADRAAVPTARGWVAAAPPCSVRCARLALRWPPSRRPSSACRCPRWPGPAGCTATAAVAVAGAPRRRFQVLETAGGGPYSSRSW